MYKYHLGTRDTSGEHLKVIGLAFAQIGRWVRKFISLSNVSEAFKR